MQKKYSLLTQIYLLIQQQNDIGSNCILLWLLKDIQRMGTCFILLNQQVFLFLRVNQALKLGRQYSGLGPLKCPSPATKIETIRPVPEFFPPLCPFANSFNTMTAKVKPQPLDLALDFKGINCHRGKQLLIYQDHLLLLMEQIVFLVSPFFPTDSVSLFSLLTSHSMLSYKVDFFVLFSNVGTKLLLFIQLLLIN